MPIKLLAVRVKRIYHYKLSFGNEIWRIRNWTYNHTSQFQSLLFSPQFQSYDPGTNIFFSFILCSVSIFRDSQRETFIVRSRVKWIIFDIRSYFYFIFQVKFAIDAFDVRHWKCKWTFACWCAWHNNHTHLCGAMWGNDHWLHIYVLNIYSLPI